MSRTRVLCDRHQADLLYSLQLLFEDRFGFELYVPIGRAWWDEGYWRFGQVFGDDRLAQQYLTLDANYVALFEIRADDSRGGTERRWVTYDTHHPTRPIRAVELEEVRASSDEWRFVVATVQENQHGFHRLAGELGAEYVYQVGNTSQQVDWALDPLALVSSEVPIRGRGVLYRQEFDADGLFGFREPEMAARRQVSSFVNCMPQIACWPLLEQHRQLLPGFRFAIHGIDGPDGNIAAAADVAQRMGASGWAWHCKPQGDGFGHVIHNWAARGRPLIGQASHYTGRLAEPFWEDLVTCIDLDRRSPEENAALIREISDDPDRHAGMCRTIRARFDELVNFDREAHAIAELLGVGEQTGRGGDLRRKVQP